MRAIIFPLALLRELIKENPAKCIIATIAIWMFAYAGSLPDTKHSVEFYHQLELRGKWVGIYGDDFDAKAFDKKPDLKGPDKKRFRELESIASILALPRYETKSGKRNRLLKMVGI